MIPFSKPYRAADELPCIAEALESGHLSGDGRWTQEASERLAEELDGAQVLLTTSGTHALELSALVLGIGEGDEVVMPSFTFASTANAFALRGARIRFAEVNRDTFSMEVEDVEAALTSRTTAVVAMPYAGVIRDMSAIADLCRRRDLKFVEDNAHGLFASSQGKPLGTFAPVAALSFHQSKNISCGEGGALILSDHSHRTMAEILREKGTDRSRFLRGEIDKYTWQTIGSSYLPSEVLAALLVSQLRACREIQARRHRLWSLYRSRLEPEVRALEIHLQSIPKGCKHPAHIFCFLVGDAKRRQGVLRYLKEAGIRATSHYEPLHLAPAMRSEQDRLPQTEQVASQMVRLPLYADLSEEDASRICDVTLEALKK